MEKDLRLRKIKGRLNSNGQGVILFSVWDIIQVVMMFTLNQEYVLKQAGIVDADQLVITLSFIFVGVFALLATLIDIYVGKTAIAVSKGEHKNVLYIVIACFIVVVSILGLVFSIEDLTSVDLNTIMSDIITVTKDVILIELIINAINLRKEAK